METHAPATLRELASDGSVDYQWHSIIDGYSHEEHDEIVRRFDAAAALINDWLTADKRVLVHCTAGVSRSVTAAIWYLMRYEGYSWDEALALIRERREVANPNIRFEIALRVAAGEDLTEEWIDRRIEEYCRLIEEQYDEHLDRAAIWKDLEQQGTLRRISAARC